MKNKLFLIFCFLFIYTNIFAVSVKIKDIATIQGLQDNQLMGIGLVTGLQGTGDSKSFRLTQSMIANLAANFGFDITAEDIASKNVAAVMVTANIGPFTRRGESLDVSLSSIGDAKSLDGGILLQTALQGANKQIYAVAQGRVLAAADSKADVCASVPNGAIIERDVISNYLNDDKIKLVLRLPDFDTANQIRTAVQSVNDNLTVTCVDAGLVEITLTDEEKNNPVEFITKLQTLSIDPVGQAIVVIDKKTGIIVTGSQVVIQQCAVSVPVSGTQNARSSKSNNLEISSSTIGELVQLLNNCGLTTKEIIGLLEAINRAGAINGKFVVM